MAKYALYKGADWLRDVHADSVEEALKMDEEATRAELVSENEGTRG